MKNKDANKTPIASRLLHVFLWSCAYFTIITLFLLIIQSFQTETRYVTPSRFLLIYPFGLAMAFGNLVLMTKALKAAAKTFLHFLITVLSFYVFLILPAQNSGNPIALLFILSVIYFLIATPILIVRHAKLKKAREETPDTSMFSKQK